MSDKDKQIKNPSLNGNSQGNNRDVYKMQRKQKKSINSKN